MTDKELGTAAGEIFAKAFTLVYETGREYVPVGGRALTAERLAELIKHAPAPNDGDYNDGYVAALTDLRDALFPATEPASYCSKGVCSANEGHDGTCAEASGWAHDAYEDRLDIGTADAENLDGWEGSTTAEPAEERRSFPTIQDVPNNTLFHTHGGNGSSLFVRNQSGDLRLCLNAGPEWSKLLRDEDFLPSSGPYVEVPWSKFPQPPADPFAQPAPAEPAEEETKAETADAMQHRFIAENAIVPHPCPTIRELETP